jgi:hypothetical protein
MNDFRTIPTVGLQCAHDVTRTGSPPGKETGALLHAPKTETARQYTRPHDAQGCTHANTRLERMPQGHVHYGRQVCAACGRSLRWLPKPETLERRSFNSFRLVKLAMCGGLSTWERNFVRDVSQRRKLSPKQSEIVDRLCATYLERPVA